MENAGTVNWITGGFTVAAGALIDNQVGAVFDMQDNSTFGVSGTVPAFNNEGLLLFSEPQFAKNVHIAIDNFGTLDVQNAPLYLNDTFTNTGSVNIGGSLYILNVENAIVAKA